MKLWSYDKAVSYVVVVDAFKVGMPMHSLISDFEVVKQGISILGCSVWVKPYNPIPLIVFNPNSTDKAVGDILEIPSVERLLDFMNLQALLYPNNQVMIAGGKLGMANLAYSQREIPAVESGYAKIESGNFSREVYEDLWASAIANGVWRK